MQTCTIIIWKEQPEYTWAYIQAVDKKQLVEWDTIEKWAKVRIMVGIGEMKVWTIISVKWN